MPRFLPPLLNDCKTKCQRREPTSDRDNNNRSQKFALSRLVSSVERALRGADWEALASGMTSPAHVDFFPDYLLCLSSLPLQLQQPAIPSLAKHDIDLGVFT
jgi:hypothetical protein